MSYVTVICPKCGKELGTTNVELVMWSECPHCGEKFMVYPSGRTESGWERVGVHEPPQPEGKLNKSEKTTHNTREMECEVNRLKKLGVGIERNPIYTKVGEVDTVVGTYKGERLNFALGEIGRSDQAQFDTVTIGGKPVWAKKSTALTLLKKKLKKTEKEPKKMKIFPEWGGLGRIGKNKTDSSKGGEKVKTVIEELQLDFLKRKR